MNNKICVALNSVLLSKATYLPTINRLILTFRDKGAYVYDNVDINTFYNLVHTDSCGQTFNFLIKDNFTPDQLDYDPFWEAPMYHIFQSEFIQGGTYNGSRALLLINHKRYELEMLPECWEEFITNSSAGKYFNDFLKNSTRPFREPEAIKKPEAIIK